MPHGKPKTVSLHFSSKRWGTKNISELVFTGSISVYINLPEKKNITTYENTQINLHIQESPDQPLHWSKGPLFFMWTIKAKISLQIQSKQGLVAHTYRITGTPQPFYNTIVGVHSINRVS